MDKLSGAATPETAAAHERASLAKSNPHAFFLASVQLARLGQFDRAITSMWRDCEGTRSTCQMALVPSRCVLAGQGARAAALHAEYCDEGNAAACYMLTIMLRDGRGVPVDLPRAHSIAQAQCGARVECAVLGTVLEREGKGPEGRKMVLEALRAVDAKNDRYFAESHQKEREANTKRDAEAKVRAERAAAHHSVLDPFKEALAAAEAELKAMQAERRPLDSRDSYKLETLKSHEYHRDRAAQRIGPEQAQRAAARASRLPRARAFRR